MFLLSYSDNLGLRLNFRLKVLNSLAIQFSLSDSFKKTRKIMIAILINQCKIDTIRLL